MLLSLALATLVSLPSDTITVRPGDTLVVERLSGELLLEGSSDERISVLRDDVEGGFQFERRGSQIHLTSRRGRSMDGTLELRVPEGTRVRINGGDLDVEIEGMRAGVSVETLDGDVYLRGIAGPTEVFTLDGDLSLRGAEGPVVLSTLDGEIEVSDMRGSLRVESTDGDLILRGIESDDVRATTLDGDVTFSGSMTSAARVSLSTHSGDVTLTLAANINAAFEISTVDGNFESDFPVRVHGVGANQAIRFSLGDGQARIQIQNFDGDIRLLRR